MSSWMGGCISTHHNAIPLRSWDAERRPFYLPSSYTLDPAADEIAAFTLTRDSHQEPSKTTHTVRGSIFERRLSSHVSVTCQQEASDYHTCIHRREGLCLNSVVQETGGHKMKPMKSICFGEGAYQNQSSVAAANQSQCPCLGGVRGQHTTAVRERRFLCLRLGVSMFRCLVPRASSGKGRGRRVA